MPDDPRQPMKVLVTGAAGTIGGALCRELHARGHLLRGLDIAPLTRPVPGLADMRQVDLADADGVGDAVAGMDAVVHLAALPGDADFMSKLLVPNVVGVYNVLEAARRHGVARVVLTSTVQVVFGYDWQARLNRVEDPPRPVNHYAVTKVFAEAWGRMYAQRHGLSVIVVRPGHVPHRKARAHEDTRREYFSRGDAARLFAQCVEAPSIDFAVLFGASRSEEPLFDLEPARRLVGFEPRDTWPHNTQPGVDL